jgi:L-serine dehydratase
MTTPVSIFNDVIGPVMRGPSSSHCAAALRIGRLARDLMAEASIQCSWNSIAMARFLPPTIAKALIWDFLVVCLGWNADDERLTAIELLPI